MFSTNFKNNDLFRSLCYVKDIEGMPVFLIDDIQTAVSQYHKNTIKGFIVKDDLLYKPCYVVKYENEYAHGETMKQAFYEAFNKSRNKIPVDERISAFIKKFPTLTTLVSASELFKWHNTLTGSCELGRKFFSEKFNIDIEKDMISVRDFIDMTKDAYHGEIIV